MSDQKVEQGQVMEAVKEKVKDEVKEAERTNFISRRKMLASLGLAGVALASSALLNGAPGIGLAHGQASDGGNDNGNRRKKTRPRDLMNTDYCEAVTIAQLRAETSPNAGCIYFVTNIGQEGPYYYDSGDTTSSDNTGLVIVSTSGARFKRIFDGAVNVKWFGAKGDGATDDTAAFQAAINSVIAHGNRNLIAPTASYKIAGTILVPSGYSIDLCWSTLVGNGLNTNTIFESAYVNALGGLSSNIGTPPESNRVINTVIRKGIIQYCGKAFHLYNFNEGCELSDFNFFECTYSVHSSRPFYSRYVNMTSRGTANGALNAAFYFDTYVNVVVMESLFCIDRKLCFEIANSADGLLIQNCSAETCENGFKISGEGNLITFENNYFEFITGTAIDMTSSLRKDSITIDNNWFHGVNVAMKGTTVLNGRVGRGNRYYSGNCLIDFSDDYYDFVNVEVTEQVSPSSQIPAQAANLMLGGKCELDQTNVQYDPISGLAVAKAKVLHGLIPLHYNGDSGEVAEQVLFCNVSSSGGVNFDVIVDTGIAFRPSTMMCAFRLNISDNADRYVIYGNIYGDKVMQFDSTGKTVTVSNNNGMLQLKASGFSHPLGQYVCEGVVRIL